MATFKVHNDPSQLYTIKLKDESVDFNEVVLDCFTVWDEHSQEDVQIFPKRHDLSFSVFVDGNGNHMIHTSGTVEIDVQQEAWVIANDGWVDIALEFVKEDGDDLIPDEDYFFVFNYDVRLEKV